MTNMGKIWVLGIDPGKNTGMALLNTTNNKLYELWTSNFWDAFRYAVHNQVVLKAVVVEVPDNKHVFHKPVGGIAQIQRTAVNVGGVLREAELLAQGIEQEGIPVIRCTPRGKIKAARFKELTGWEGKSNEHSRDAAMLTYRHAGNA